MLPKSVLDTTLLSNVTGDTCCHSLCGTQLYSLMLQVIHVAIVCAVHNSISNVTDDTCCHSLCWTQLYSLMLQVIHVAIVCVGHNSTL